MATTLKLRRGTTAAHSTFTGAAGEVTVDTDKDVVVVHDGTTAGGFPAVRAGGTVTASAGTVSAPAITTTGDTNTGIFFPAADTIAFAEGGVESMRINSSGNLGIGTATPTQELTVYRDLDGGAVILVDNPNAGTSANTALQLATDSGLANFIANSSTSTNAAITGGALGAGLYTSSALTNGLSVGTTSGPLKFFAGSTSAERARIDSSGNVGIGTGSPLAKLNVNGADGELIRISVTPDAGVIQEPALGFATGVANTYPAAKISALEFDASDSRASLLFYTRDSNSDIAPTERMRIDSAGNVGIGTAAPAYELDVQNTGDTVFRVKANSSGAAADDDATIIIDAAETGEAVLSFRMDGTQIGFIESNDASGFLKVATTVASGDYITFFPAETEAVRINAAGTLLAGTQFSEYTLGGINAPVQIAGTTQNTSSLTTLVWSTSTITEPNIVLGKGYNATPGTYTATASGQNIGQIAFAASDGTAINNGAGIVASTTGTWSGSSRPTQMEFYAVPSGSTSGTTSLVINGSGLTSQPTYDNTAAGSTVIVTSAGLIRRTSSSLKYKKDVEDLDSLLASNAVDNLRPVWYRTKNAEGDDKETWSHIGLIAEEVHTVEPRLVRYRTVSVTKDENNKNVETLLDTPEPEDVDYGRLAVLLLAEVKNLKARIAVLEAK
jgi:hypothetical protein